MKAISDRALERLRQVSCQDDPGDIAYRLLDQVGRGGMGVVYLAEDTRLGRQVALKVLDAADESGELATRLVREAQILARLEHPGIVPVHDVGRLRDGRLFYTMKLVRGQRLDEYLASGPALPERLRLFVRICEAVAFAHSRDVLHRDLKPTNIMVGAFGEVLVMDWGVAKVLRRAAGAVTGSEGRRESSRPASGVTAESSRWLTDGGLTEAGAIMGTPGYMAPEQARGEVDTLDQRVDVYSLGAVLEGVIAAGAVDPQATTLTWPGDAVPAPAGPAGRDRLPRRLRAIVAKAKSSRREDRYDGALELAADVESFLDDRAVSALPERLWTRIGRFLARHRVAVVLILVYVIVRTLVLLFAGR